MFRAATAGVDTEPFVNEILGNNGDDEAPGEAPGQEEDDGGA